MSSTKASLPINKPAETKAKSSKRIIIAGGGTAGWMAASLFQHHFSSKGYLISLVESPQIGIIGVGEGSTPSLKRFFEQLSIPESEWMSACHATYKVNIEFEGWSPESAHNVYSHPFTSQVDTFSEKPFQLNCLTRRLGLDVNTRPSDFFLCSWLARHKKSPIAPPNFPFTVEYGYHFDSGLLGQFLSKRVCELGVEHIQDTIEKVCLHENGDIKSLETRGGSSLEADFFVDCTGFESLLMQKALGVGFKSFKDNLFNDSAVAIPTSAVDKYTPQTKATALSHGWAWQIPLQHRTGNGYVYSSDYISAESAELELRQHLGLLDQDVPAKHLKMKVGSVDKHWYRNCLAIGLSQGFIEPLEATALHLTQVSIESFIDCVDLDLPAHAQQNQQAQFNQEMSQRYERVRDYIVAHYKLNTRSDSQYWIDNRDNMKLSTSLLELLTVWYRQGDLNEEIKRQNMQSHFGSASWHCLLAGYGAFPKLASQQPGTGDQFKELKLKAFYEACLLNFTSLDFDRY